MKGILRALAGLVIIGAGLFAARTLIGMKEQRPVVSPPRATKLVKTLPVTLSNEPPLTYIKGRVLAVNKIEIFAEVNGVVLNSAKVFREGVRFERGETMLRMDDTEPKMALLAQRSAFLQLLTSALPDLKIDYPDAYPKWRAYTADFDVAQTLSELPEFSSDQEKFFLSNRGILNQFYSIRSAEERLSKYTLQAPFAGEVTLSSINQGALVRAGQKIGELVSSGGFEVESAISREALAFVAVGDSVQFTTDAGATVTGSVARVLKTIDPSTQTAKVFVRVDDAALRDGVYLSGTIYSKPLPEVMRIARELLVGESVYTVVADSVLTLTPVQIAALSERDALITGVREGTLLLAEPLSNAFDGMVVKLDRE
ncbi:MAG: efflux RND transporter periplasmic adaptor subunit [Flavobacteriales bacterium]